MRKLIKNICLLLIVILLGVMAYNGYLMITEKKQEEKEEQAFVDIAEVVHQKEVEISEKVEETEEEFVSPYQDLYEQNNDLIGWITIPNTKVDYPVMMTPNDFNYYLRRAFDGTSANAGCLFVGGGSDPDGLSFIIYGHNMHNGTMFGNLEKYLDKSFYDANPVFSFNTLTEMREYEIFAVFKTEIRTESITDYQYYQYIGDFSEEDFNGYMNLVNSCKEYETGVEVEYGDQIIMLSTCDYDSDVSRFVVCAKRVK